jgi:hypothetical protein
LETSRKRCDWPPSVGRVARDTLTRVRGATVAQLSVKARMRVRLPPGPFSHLWRRSIRGENAEIISPSNLTLPPPPPILKLTESCTTFLMTPDIRGHLLLFIYRVLGERPTQLGGPKRQPAKFPTLTTKYRDRRDVTRPLPYGPYPHIALFRAAVFGASRRLTLRAESSVRATRFKLAARSSKLARSPIPHST